MQEKPVFPGIAPHDCRRACAKLCRASGGDLEQIQMLLGHASVQIKERYLGTKQDLAHAPNDAIRLKVAPFRFRRSPEFFIGWILADLWILILISPHSGSGVLRAVD